MRQVAKLGAFFMLSIFNFMKSQKLSCYLLRFKDIK
jgi:hypothetical protein